MMDKKSSKNVFYLGLVSLFTDLSSQMVYPLIPEFLVQLGANKSLIGLIEGIAESTSSLFRTVFGRLSDKFKKRKFFIYLGYGLSAISRPFLFFANSWITVLVIKFSDRTGKAMRTPARDALISTSVSSKDKGKSFGFHRAMDRIGAIGGPLLAIVLLSVYDNNLRLVFLLSVVPALIALIFIIFAREVKTSESDSIREKNTSFIKNSPFIIFLVANMVFTLGNSSNAFLILKAREVGISISMIPVLWVLYNIFCTISSPVLGSLSDKLGRQPIIIISFIYYSLLYILFGISDKSLSIWILFGAYGIYYGLSEGIYRAYIADLIVENKRATAYGLFNTGTGLALFPASIIMGMVWDTLGSKWAFFISAAFSILGFLIFIMAIGVKKFSKKLI